MNKPYIPFLFSILSLALTSLDTEAHTQLGALGATATATDIYLATCLNDGSGLPDNLVGKIIDLPPVVAARVALTVSKDGKPTGIENTVRKCGSREARGFILSRWPNRPGVRNCTGSSSIAPPPPGYIPVPASSRNRISKAVA